MQTFLPIMSRNDNTLKPIFNSADFNYNSRYITYGDLMKYASLSGFNAFTGLNSYTVINFNEYLNGVSPSTFNFLINVSSDIQDQFNTLFNRTTAQSYSNGVTLFNGSLSSPVIVLNGGNLESRLIVDENNISALKTKCTALNYDDNVSSFSGSVSIASLFLNGSDLDVRLTNAETDISGSKADIVDIKGRLTGHDVDISGLNSDVLTINNKLIIDELDISGLKVDVDNLNLAVDVLNNSVLLLGDGVVDLSNNQTIGGSKVFLNVPKIGLNNIATITDISGAISTLLGGAGSALDTLKELGDLLVSDVSAVSVIMKTMVDISSSQVIVGQKQFNKVIVTQPSTMTDLSLNNMLFTGKLNNISPTTFGYLTNLTSNIQSQINNLSSFDTGINTSLGNLSSKFINYVYDISSNTQSFNGTTGFNQVITNKIINNDIINNSIVSNNINVHTLTCDNIKSFQPLPYPVVYLTNLHIQYPIGIIKLGLVSDLNGLDITEPISFTVLPYTKITFLDINKSTIIFINNDTDEYMYNVTFSFTQEPFYFIVERTKI